MTNEYLPALPPAPSRLQIAAEPWQEPPRENTVPLGQEHDLGTEIPPEIRISSGEVNRPKEDNELSEDCPFRDDRKQVYAVADGAGKTADSRLAAEKSTEYFNELTTTDLLDHLEKSSDEHAAEIMSSVINQVNERIQQDKDSGNIDPTGAAAFTGMAIRGNRAFIWNAGDCGIVRIRDGKYERLTTDQSDGNLLLNAVDGRAKGNNETTIADVEPGDLFILASDGFFGDYPFQEIPETAVLQAVDQSQAENEETVALVLSELAENFLHENPEYKIDYWRYSWYARKKFAPKKDDRAIVVVRAGGPPRNTPTPPAATRKTYERATDIDISELPKLSETEQRILEYIAKPGEQLLGSRLGDILRNLVNDSAYDLLKELSELMPDQAAETVIRRALNAYNASQGSSSHDAQTADDLNRKRFLVSMAKLWINSDHTLNNDQIATDYSALALALRCLSPRIGHAPFQDSKTAANFYRDTKKIMDFLVVQADKLGEYEQ